MTRAAWRAFYRAMRITRRESEKAFMDAVVFGTGWTKAGDHGEWKRDGSDIVRHVPTLEVWNHDAA